MVHHLRRHRLCFDDGWNAGSEFEHSRAPGPVRDDLPGGLSNLADANDPDLGIRRDHDAKRHLATCSVLDASLLCFIEDDGLLQAPVGREFGFAGVW